MSFAFSAKNKAILKWLQQLNTHLGGNVSWTVGKKWVKVWHRHNPISRSIYLFICPEGNLYKPEGIHRPHPAPRGNIATIKPESCDENGAWLYLRRR